MMVYGADKDFGLEKLNNESKEAKRVYGTLVRSDATDKRKLRKRLHISSTNGKVSISTYKEYRLQRVTKLTDVEKEREQVRLLTEKGFIERRVLSRTAKRLKAKQLSVVK